jgi:hypothetical protein
MYCWVTFQTWRAATGIIMRETYSGVWYRLLFFILKYFLIKNILKKYFLKKLFAISTYQSNPKHKIY